MIQAAIFTVPSCWTTDRLQTRVMPHPKHCLLCDQEEETAQHILALCVFATQFSCAILQPINLVRLTPMRSASFADWWMKAENRIQKQHRKGFKSF